MIADTDARFTEACPNLSAHRIIPNESRPALRGLRWCAVLVEAAQLDKNARPIFRTLRPIKKGGRCGLTPI